MAKRKPQTQKGLILAKFGGDEAAFYNMYPTEQDYNMAMGGIPKMFPQIQSERGFFSRGYENVPAPYQGGSFGMGGSSQQKAKWVRIIEIREEKKITDPTQIADAINKEGMFSTTPEEVHQYLEEYDLSQGQGQDQGGYMYGGMPKFQGQRDSSQVGNLEGIERHGPWNPMPVAVPTPTFFDPTREIRKKDWENIPAPERGNLVPNPNVQPGYFPPPSYNPVAAYGGGFPDIHPFPTQPTMSEISNFGGRPGPQYFGRGGQPCFNCGGGVSYGDGGTHDTTIPEESKNRTTDFLDFLRTNSSMAMQNNIGNQGMGIGQGRNGGWIPRADFGNISQPSFNNQSPFSQQSMNMLNLHGQNMANMNQKANIGQPLKQLFGYAYDNRMGRHIADVQQKQQQQQQQQQVFKGQEANRFENTGYSAFTPGREIDPFDQAASWNRLAGPVARYGGLPKAQNSMIAQGSTGKDDDWKFSKKAYDDLMARLAQYEGQDRRQYQNQGQRYQNPFTGGYGNNWFPSTSEPYIRKQNIYINGQRQRGVGNPFSGWGQQQGQYQNMTPQQIADHAKLLDPRITSFDWQKRHFGQGPRRVRATWAIPDYGSGRPRITGPPTDDPSSSQQVNTLPPFIGPSPNPNWSPMGPRGSVPTTVVPGTTPNIGRSRVDPQRLQDVIDRFTKTNPSVTPSASTDQSRKFLGMFPNKALRMKRKALRAPTEGRTQNPDDVFERGPYESATRPQPEQQPIQQPIQQGPYFGDADYLQTQRNREMLGIMDQNITSPEGYIDETVYDTEQPGARPRYEDEMTGEHGYTDPIDSGNYPTDPRSDLQRFTGESDPGYFGESHDPFGPPPSDDSFNPQRSPGGLDAPGYMRDQLRLSEPPNKESIMKMYDAMQKNPPTDQEGREGRDKVLEEFRDKYGIQYPTHYGTPDADAQDYPTSEAVYDPGSFENFAYGGSRNKRIKKRLPKYKKGQVIYLEGGEIDAIIAAGGKIEYM